MSSDEFAIPFSVNDWVIDLVNPSMRGQFTGRSHARGKMIMVELRYPDGTTRRRPLSKLEAIQKSEGDTIFDKLSAARFGKAGDLQRLITYEKLKGTLHEVVYSMEAAQIDFYPYQFKPVLKFINSPTERLIIADEVGLGKTIESSLIWMELQARRQAKRLLVVCPKILTEKWRDELRNKFAFDARIVDFKDLQQEISDLKQEGPTHPFVLIASYTGLRPPKKDINLLDTPPDDNQGSSKTQLLREIRHWSYTYTPFDLVIFDEAHYMRNSGTSTFYLGESLASHNETAVLCVSATPVNNSNNDLHSLLRLIDSDFFETQGMFDELLKINRPTIQMINRLGEANFNLPKIQESVTGMSESEYIRNTPLFEKLLEFLSRLEQNPKDRRLMAKAQEIAEDLNLLGNYINRTRRIQVEEKRPVRRVVVLPVIYTNEEMLLYKAILKLVRGECARDAKIFHVFRVLGLQLKAASSLPVIADEISQGKLGRNYFGLDDLASLLNESVGHEVYQGFEMVFDDENEFEGVDLRELVKYDFESNDQKFQQLLQLLKGEAIDADGRQINTEGKFVIFAFYRQTLAYLKRRLHEEGFSTATIHGGIEHEDRWEELERFKSPDGPEILLSSEVGSEGIDLQFCRIIVNYDLPWNPMRIEQRIGRIDRVGQKAEVLLIINFKVKDTVEERLYDRLHDKLLKFANSLGDLESVVGDEVQNLTVDILSKDLTPKEEITRMEKAEQAIANQLEQIEQLETKGDTLVAFGDYVQKKVKEDKKKGRYVLPEELEDYLLDFFEREFIGCEIQHNTPENHCFRLKLSPSAKASLTDFIRDDRSLISRPLRQREISLTFRRETYSSLPSKQRRKVHFINHLSPLIRWITHKNNERKHAFYNVSALQLDHDEIPSGNYCYIIERWLLRGLSNRETLAYSIAPIGGSPLEAEQSEKFIQNILRNGKDWDYPDIESDLLISTYNDLEEEMIDRFDEACDIYEAENSTAIQIRMQRAANHWDRLISQSEKAIKTMKSDSRKESLIKGRNTRLKNERLNKRETIEKLEKGKEIDPEQSPVAAGIFRIK